MGSVDPVGKTKGLLVTPQTFPMRTKRIISYTPTNRNDRQSDSRKSSYSFFLPLMVITRILTLLGAILYLPCFRRDIEVLWAKWFPIALLTQPSSSLRREQRAKKSIFLFRMTTFDRVNLDRFFMSSITRTYYE